MDDEYLKKGIIGLSRTLDSGLDSTARSWFAGHVPCAVLAAYYFCRNNPIEPGVDEAVTREVDGMIDRLQVQRPQAKSLFVPEGVGEDGEARTLDDIVQALQGCIGRYWGAGHNVIYAAYALQVLREKPELATPPVVNGIFKIIDYFRANISGEVPVWPCEEFLSKEQEELTPEYKSEDDMIQEVFTALQYAPRVVDRGRLAFDGHTLTHAHALVMLSRLGLDSVARQGYDAHRLHLEGARGNRSVMKIESWVQGWSKMFTVPDHPFTLGYWNRDYSKFDGSWTFNAHTFKYLYSFYDLLDRVHEPLRKKSCELQMAWLH